MSRQRLYLQRRVSNPLAVLSALLLLVSSLAGMSSSAYERNPSTALSMSAPSSRQAEREEVPVEQGKAHKGFRISLMLFH